MIKIFEVECNKENHAWKKDVSKYGSFIIRENLPQQIRMDPGVEIKTITVVDRKITEDLTVKETSILFEQENVRFFPDPRTMNVSVRAQSPMLNDSNFKGESLVILIVSMDYPMVRYRTDFDIMNTFHNTRKDAKERYYGCMICAPESAYLGEEEIFRLQTLDGNDFRFMNLKNGMFNSTVIRNLKIVKSLKEEWKRKKERASFFHVSVTGGNRTCFLIGKTKDLPDEIVAEINEKWNDGKNYEDLRVFLLPDNINPEAPSKKLMSALDTSLKERPRTRAVTIFNNAISPALLKDYRLLYIFGMDTSGAVKVLKSN